jgi:tetratricopeptide (TPR) repeat protein
VSVLWNILEWICFIGLFAFWTWYSLTICGDSIKKYLARWAATFGILFLLYLVSRIGPIPPVFMGTFLAVMLAVVWRNACTELFGGWIGHMFSGGNQQADKKPLLSQAEGLRHKGKPKEAIQSARTTLTIKPDDFDTLMFIASIQAEDLDRLDSAVITLEDALRSKRIERGQIVYALNTLADWHLKVLEPEAARGYLRRIIDLLPDTDAAQRAEQRVIRMKDRAAMVADAQTRTIEMPEFERDLGLKGKKSTVKRKGSNPVAIIAELERELEKHPNDWTAREELAGVYANEHKNVKRAVEELEILVSGAKAPRREIARWLHLIADWQSRLGKDPDSARFTLDRIIDRFPDTVLAQRAEHAKAYLRESR